MAALSYAFSGSGESGPRTFSLQADIASNFECQAKRIAFDKTVNVDMQGRLRLRAKVRFSASIESRQSLEVRLPQSSFEMRGADFRVRMHLGVLAIEIEYDSIVRNAGWSFESGDFDFTQPVKVDLVVPKIGMLPGRPLLSLRNGENYLKPSITCFLRVDIKKVDPSRMEVADTKEDFENNSVVEGGRPESNRRKF